jgi:voltage-gated potassium channel
MPMSPPVTPADSSLGNPEGQSEEARDFGCPAGGWRRRLFVVIFESDTRAGRAFDLALLGVILMSLSVVMLDSLTPTKGAPSGLFWVLEWVFTLLFTAEYVARLACVDRPRRYVRSFFGIVDLLAVLPTYLAVLLPGAQSLLNVRALRLLRVFRILKLTAYIQEYRALGRAMRASGRKILVFLATVALIVVLLGTLMYVVEGPANGFTSIPMAIYWAITTITTVGFGDITPRTDLGRVIASFIMLLGWGILAVPTGIVTAELAGQQLAAARNAQPGLGPGAPPADVPAGTPCVSCGCADHVPTARFCHACGAALSR